MEIKAAVYYRTKKGNCKVLPGCFDIYFNNKNGTTVGLYITKKGFTIHLGQRKIKNPTAKQFKKWAKALGKCEDQEATEDEVTSEDQEATPTNEVVSAVEGIASVISALAQGRK